MNLSMLLLSCGLLAPAQAEGDSSLRPATRATFTDAGGEQAEMYRHIEVMRQLLRVKLAQPGSALTGTASSVPGTTYFPNYPIAQSPFVPAGPSADAFGSAAPGQNFYGNGSAALGLYTTAPVDGVYLPGYGVVFTVSLPAIVRPLRPVTTKPAPKALSDWERAEKELKGEKTEQAPASNPPPSVTDIIVDLLAMNGQRFTKLRDGERITVVVTLHDTHTVAAAQPLFNALTTAGQYAPLTTFRGSVSQNAAPGLPGAAQPNPTPSQAKDYELLADMHLKQKQYDSALSAYAKAIAKVEAESKSNPTEIELLYLASLLLRQAQAHVGTGNLDAAVSLLRRIDSIQTGSDPVYKTPSSNAPPRQKDGPSKLIISAPKVLINEIQKISLPDFRKGLQIDELPASGR